MTFRVEGDPSGLVERLRTAIQNAGGNQAVAAKSGVPLGTLNNYVRGVSEPKAIAISMIALACGVSTDWLFFGSADSGNMQVATEHMTIARYELHASAGNGSRQFDDPPSTQWTFPRELLRGFKGKISDLMSTDVFGDSMEPTLKDGQAIIVDRSARFDREAVYLLTVGDDLFVKRLRRVPGEDGQMSLSLISDNPAYPELTLGPDTQERVRIIGRVIWPDTSRRRF